MKIQFTNWLCLGLVFGVASAFAQTNTFPSSGSVGIGTISPAQKLEVAGNVLFGTNVSGATATPARMDLGTSYSNGTTRDKLKIYLYNSGTEQYGFSVGGGGDVQYHSNGFHDFYIANSLTLRINSSGNVGIGTSAPTAKLDVVGQIISHSAGDALAVSASSAGFVGLYLQNDYYTAGTYNRIVTDSVGGLTINHNGTDYFYMGRNGDPTAWFSGNVGIGTTNPIYKLAVNGTIRAKEVIVDTGWSDYVFDATYRLAPLSEVEAHIKAERHLPGIPSAQEIAAGGVSLGDMQAKLLAKIEELTLHQIEQEKRLQHIESENQFLRSMVGTPANP